MSPVVKKLKNHILSICIYHNYENWNFSLYCGRMQIEIWDVALELGISADLEVAKHEPGGKFFKLGKPRF